MSRSSGPVHGPDETLDYIGPYSFVQKERGHRLTSDTISLADFVLPLEKNDAVIDLGTGTGALPLIFSFRSVCASITGVELLNEEAALAKRNALDNGLGARVEIIKADLRTLEGIFEKGAFSVVVSNPPYRKSGGGDKSPHENRAAARFEGSVALKDIAAVSRYLLSTEGRVCIVYPVERIFEALREFRFCGFHITRLRFVRSNRTKRAKVFLLEARLIDSPVLAIDEVGAS